MRSYRSMIEVVDKGSGFMDCKSVIYGGSRT